MRSIEGPGRLVAQVPVRQRTSPCTFASIMNNHEGHRLAYPQVVLAPNRLSHASTSCCITDHLPPLNSCPYRTKTFALLWTHFFCSQKCMVLMKHIKQSVLSALLLEVQAVFSSGHFHNESRKWSFQYSVSVSGLESWIHLDTAWPMEADFPWVPSPLENLSLQCKQTDVIDDVSHFLLIKRSLASELCRQPLKHNMKRKRQWRW